jgi:hypothetical protein
MVALVPFGREVVPIDEARAMGRETQNIDFGSV